MTSTSLSLLRPQSIVVDATARPQASRQSAVTTKRKMPSLSMPKLKLDSGALKGAVPSLGGLGSGGRSRKAELLVGLDIQPGYVAAVQARVNGAVLVQRAAGAPLPPDTVREGEVLDADALSDTLRELFRSSGLDRRVRVGVANQRTVLRTLELPPITDRKELAAAVRFEAADQMPMPLDSASLDFYALGVTDTPAGPRQRVIVVAAQRDMIEKLMAAVRGAGLRPEGIDLSAFALIRALHGGDGGEEEESKRVLYLNVGGLTNMAIAEGSVCRFTRVAGGGLESIAGGLAARQNMPMHEARALLARAELTAAGAETPLEPSDAPDVHGALLRGVREIAGEVRNSLDFHRLQEGGGEVSSIVVSGPALQISGFAEALGAELHVPVKTQTVELLSDDATRGVSPEHLAVAAGLAVEEAPR